MFDLSWLSKLLPERPPKPIICGETYTSHCYHNMGFVFRPNGSGCARARQMRVNECCRCLHEVETEVYNDR